MALKTPFHIIFAAAYSYACYWNICIGRQLIEAGLSQKLPFPRFFLHLTSWNVGLNAVYFTLKSLKLASSKKSKTFFFGILGPMSLIVCFYFWALMFNDPKNLSSGKKRAFFPVIYSHLSHTTQFFSTVLELIFYSSEASSSATNDKTKIRYKFFRSKIHYFSMIMPLLYFTWALYIRFEFGEWVYPFLKILWNSKNHAYFHLLFVGTCVLYSFIGWALSGLHDMMVSEDDDGKKEK